MCDNCGCWDGVAPRISPRAAQRSFEDQGSFSIAPKPAAQQAQTQQQQNIQPGLPLHRQDSAPISP